MLKENVVHISYTSHLYLLLQFSDVVLSFLFFHSLRIFIQHLLYLQFIQWSSFVHFIPNFTDIPCHFLHFYLYQSVLSECAFDMCFFCFIYLQHSTWLAQYHFVRKIDWRPSRYWLNQGIPYIGMFRHGKENSLCQSFLVFFIRFCQKKNLPSNKCAYAIMNLHFSLYTFIFSYQTLIQSDPYRMLLTRNNDFKVSSQLLIGKPSNVHCLHMFWLSLIIEISMQHFF